MQSDVSNLNTSLSNTAKALQTQGTTLANQAKELQTQASQLTAQAKAQETLTTRVESVETTANGTKTTVSELSKTVAQNGKDITSVSNRTKTVETGLTSAKTSISELQTSVSTAQTDLTNLTKRTKTVEDGLTGTKTNLSELTQTVSNDGKTIASLTSRTKTVEDSVSGLKTTMSSVQKDLTAVTTRTKTVEDDLSGTKTTLSQVKTTADSTSQKAATLESGLDGLTARFDNLKIGAVNLLHNSKGPFQPKGSRIDNYVTYSNAWINMEKGKEYTLSAKGTAPFTSKHATDQEKNEICLWLVKHDENINVDRIISNATTGTAGTKFTWNDPSGKYRLRVNTYKVDNSNYAEEVQIEEGNLRSTYSQNKSDIESKVAEYKQTSDQNYASLQTTVQNLDGTVQANKTTAEQTAAGFKTRIESLETYKSGESTRANQYFESAKTETARQLTSERTAIAKDYVAKSTYTSDVTGLRNDLTATTTTANTTKTNLANYQASNDKAVANLQRNLQTANGNISSLQTKIEAVPGQITSAVSAVEGKIPTTIGGRNYLRGTSDEYQTYTNTNYILGYPSTYRDWTKLLDPLRDKTVTIRAYIKNDTDYPVRIQIWFTAGGIYGNTVAPHSEGWSVKTGKMSANWTSANVALTQAGTNPTGGSIQVKKAKLEIGNIPSDWSPAPEDYDSKLATAQSEIKQTTDSIKASVSSLDKSTVKSASLTINTDGIVMKAGKSTTDVANAIGSYFAVNQNAINLFSDKINVKGSMIVDGAITSNKIASQSINTAHLNGKIITADVIATGAITANAIKAGAVTTDKMTANSINGDRITAGTLDAAKIKAGSITASQIASGTITSAQIKTGTISAANIAAGAITTDKIAANSINSSKIVSSGITANVIKGGKLQSLSNATNFELDTGKLFYNNNNTGIFRVQANASTMGLKFSNTSITVSGTSRILSRVILGGDRRETSLDDGKWDQGGFSGIVVETINGIAANDHERADSLRVIADNIYFGHSYNKDVVTNTSAAGWKMETYPPTSTFPSHVVLRPYGISYRNADIITGDVRLDNGDGSGYYVRSCIQILRNCFQHIINGGTSSDAINAIRSAISQISGV
ncbi:hypothetical protein [Streptococcus pasteurianus]|uniref:hypothetical protein n=1 Tax=Streptococcus pasteurianus TaxID=197614 RepID=UPI0020012899|nr:hypothetical protein [Streptococcus pasteurianus]